MNITYQLFDLMPEWQQFGIAQVVSEYTKGQMEDPDDPVQMLAQGQEAIQNKAIGLVALNGEEFAGYIAGNEAMYHNDKLVSEVGTLVVAKQFRHHGIAHELVNKMTSQLVDLSIHPYAFCNIKSAPIFGEAGYQPVCSWQVPKSALEWCETSCKKKPFITSVCCDQILAYTGVVVQ